MGCNNNNGFSSFSSEANRLKQAQTTGETVFDWPPKTSSFPASDRNWRRRPVSMSTSTSIQQPIRLSPGGTKWKSPSLAPQSVADDKGSPSLNASIVHALHAPEAPDPSDVRASGDILINGAEPEAPHQPTSLVQSTSNETSSQELEVDIQSPQQHESSFVIPVSKGLGTPQAKRAASAYYGIQSTSQKVNLLTTLNVNCFSKLQKITVASGFSY
ncbi:hypothetical protein FBUS_01386 [Fasciolopsis buskii]|uniref:Uncharacterized protein n=1 Tax=Fasciolopsis buskii TaxID=27845 RepID=A0A8E0VLF2_9TREM|nr:hypothetical protein FBUS_01386 [Fasciolopsis buski]